MESQLASWRVQGRRRISQAEGRYRDRRLGLSQQPGGLPEGSRTAEQDRAARLAGTALHMAGLDRVPAAVAHPHPPSDFGVLSCAQRDRTRRYRNRAWSAVSIHAANAIQKNTNDTIVSQRQPIST